MSFLTLYLTEFIFARASINFLVSSKLLPYNCKTFSSFLSVVSNSFRDAVVKNLDIKFVLYESKLVANLFNSDK